MKAISFSEFGGPDVLQLLEVPEPVPQLREFLVKVTAAGVNFVDIRERQGAYNKSATKVGGIAFPRTPGLQVSGTVVEVGPDGDQSLVGTNVLSLLSGGGYAEFAVGTSANTVILPMETDHFQMAALPVQGLTAYLMLQASTRLRPGESVLVHGAGGGVGSLAIQIAKTLDAGLVIATASTQAKRDLALRLGADFVVDYTLPNWTDAVLELTACKGVDILLESIGGEVFEQNFACLAAFGRCIVFGSTRGPGAPLEYRRLMARSQTISGIYLPTYQAQPNLIQKGLTFLVEHSAIGNVRAEVDRILPLSNAAEAHRLLEAQQVVGSIVLDPQA